jgi:hypothetical protein
MQVPGRRPARRAPAVLSRRTERFERWSQGRVAPLNLIVVVVFALVAVVLLAKTTFDARGIGDDFDSRITPQFSAVDTDLGRLPALDRTGAAAEDIATMLLPIAESLGRTADAVAAAARDTEAVRDDAAPIGKSVAGIDASVVGIRASLRSLAPLVVEIVAGSGDISRNLGGARLATDRAAAALTRVLANLRGVVVDARSVRARLEEIEASLRRTERHGANVAAAQLLRCPADTRACLP